MAKADLINELPPNLDEFETWHAAQPEHYAFIGGESVMMSRLPRAPDVFEKWLTDDD